MSIPLGIEDPERLIPIRRVQLQKRHLRCVQAVRLQEELMLHFCKILLLFLPAEVVGGEKASMLFGKLSVQCPPSTMISL